MYSFVTSDTSLALTASNGARQEIVASYFVWRHATTMPKQGSAMQLQQQILVFEYDHIDTIPVVRSFDQGSK